MMMKIVTVANTSGGVGKTTTAHALAVASVEYGKKV
jgi:cellulose biosynthesis protein BcsQ